MDKARLDTIRARCEAATPGPWTGFNPRARAGRDISPWVFPDEEGGFNPRARAGRD
mgnify:CR=1 FL=1